MSITVKENLVFSHINEKVPEPGEDVLISDGVGGLFIGSFTARDEDEIEVGDVQFEWIDDESNPVSLSDYPFWATIPPMEFPENLRNLEIKTDLRKEASFDDEDEDEEIEDLPGYEIVGSEIRKK